MTDEGKGCKRIIVEKPFGYSLKTAEELNHGLQKYFHESQIYRIDHYLGKETVQNLLVTRFSNSIFEPLWNRNYIHHVEITNAETVGVEKRGGYYDKSGAARHVSKPLATDCLADRDGTAHKFFGRRNKE